MRVLLRLEWPLVRDRIHTCVDSAKHWSIHSLIAPSILRTIHPCIRTIHSLSLMIFIIMGSSEFSLRKFQAWKWVIPSNRCPFTDRITSPGSRIPLTELSPVEWNGRWIMIMMVCDWCNASKKPWIGFKLLLVIWIIQFSIVLQSKIDNLNIKKLYTIDNCR